MCNVEGILLSFLYCFCNSEVQDAIQRLVRRLKIRLWMNHGFNR
jgi:hypothetical protein